ncbi:MAG: magnesium transporter CorA [Clostridia bacterium]|nr:magnesium transporter CorA [Clostridia bacterium]
MYYLIKENLTECEKDAIKSDGAQYVAVLTSDEWKCDKSFFDMGIDIEPYAGDPFTTKAQVNYDSLTGSFCIPGREDPTIDTSFAFALDECGIVFIDDTGTADRLISDVARSKKWRLPSLERFIYDFLEQIVSRDRAILEKFDRELDGMEEGMSDNVSEFKLDRLFELKNEIRDLRMHYEQLLDLTQELEENENNFFRRDNLRFFRLFSSRIERLRNTAVAVGEHANQIRDIYKSSLDVKQNHIMTVLTIVTSIFLPLTLIVGWYGMNFKYMPELETVWGYPVVIAVSILIVVGFIWLFKKKKWL